KMTCPSLSAEAGDRDSPCRCGRVRFRGDPVRLPGCRSRPGVPRRDLVQTPATDGLNMSHQLPPLPYAYNALEPHVDEQTMRIHHDKHHAAYVNNLNAALEGLGDLADLPVEQLI